MCKLTGKPCWRQSFSGKRCSDAPTLSEATACISSLDARAAELQIELQAMDEWVDTLREGFERPHASTQAA